MSNDLHNPDFFSDSQRPSLEEMYRYLDQELSPEEQHALEVNMLDDDLFSEAMEGLSMVKDREKVGAMLGDAEQAFMKKLEKKEEEENKKIIALPPMGWLVAAAVALVLVLFSFMYFDKIKENGGNDPNFAEVNPKVEEPLGVENEASDRSHSADSKVAVDSVSTTLETLEFESENDPAPIPAPETQLDMREMEMSQTVPVEVPMDNEESAKDNLDDYDFDVAPMEEEEESLEEVTISAENLIQQHTTDLTSTNAYTIEPLRDASNRGVSKYETIAGVTAKSKADSKKSRNKNKDKKNAGKAAKTTANDGNAEEKLVMQEDEAPSEVMTSSPSPKVISSEEITISGTANNTNSDAWYIESDMAMGNATVRTNNRFNTARDLEQEGFSKYASSDYKGAAKSYEKALKIDPDNASARYYLGLSYLELKKEEKAITQFDLLLLDESNSYFEDAEWYRTQAYLALERRNEAKKELEKIESRNGKYRSKASESLKGFR